MRVVPAFTVEVDTGTLAVHDLTPGATRADVPVVLALHGITANGLAWQALADELVKLPTADKCRVVAALLDRCETAKAAAVGRLLVVELQRLDLDAQLGRATDTPKWNKNAQKAALANTSPPKTQQSSAKWAAFL